MRIPKQKIWVVYPFAHQGESVVQCGWTCINSASSHFISHMHKKLMRTCSFLYMT